MEKISKNLLAGSVTRSVSTGLPVHVHMCGHECNSPYCDTPRDVDCENCGGPPAIQRGLEPWRGRQ